MRMNHQSPPKKSGNLGRGWARVQLWDRLGGGGGARAFVLKLVRPKRSHNWSRANSRPRFPLFLKVGY